MKGSTMLSTLERLGVFASVSRSQVSDAKPFSVALLRTLKYRPVFSRKLLASIEDARRAVDMLVRWYNHEHLHSALRSVPPVDRHEGRDAATLAKRHGRSVAAKQRMPLRWTRAARNWSPVGPVGLNPLSQELSAVR